MSPHAKNKQTNPKKHQTNKQTNKQTTKQPNNQTTNQPTNQPTKLTKQNKKTDPNLVWVFSIPSIHPQPQLTEPHLQSGEVVKGMTSWNGNGRVRFAGSGRGISGCKFHQEIRIVSLGNEPTHLKNMFVKMGENLSPIFGVKILAMEPKGPSRFVERWWKTPKAHHHLTWQVSQDPQGHEIGGYPSEMYVSSNYLWLLVIKIHKDVFFTKTSGFLREKEACVWQSMKSWLVHKNHGKHDIFWFSPSWVFSTHIKHLKAFI